MTVLKDAAGVLAYTGVWLVALALIFKVTGWAFS